MSPLARGGGSQARLMMRYRAEVTRPRTLPVDEYGLEPDDDTPDILHAAMPCHAWAPRDVREVIDGDGQGVVGAIRIVAPLDCGVDEHCSISSIVDRLGRVVFEGPLTVTATTPSGASLAIMARRIRSGGV